MKDAKNAPSSPPKNLAGRVFGEGLLLALDGPAKLGKNGHWEWPCQCLIHDVDPKYIRVTKLERGAIKSCGCHGGSAPKNNKDLIGQQIGFVKVLSKTRLASGRPEFLVRCVVCKREKWVRAENLRKHIGISCICAPRLKHRTIGQYHVLDKPNRKNDGGLPEVQCKGEDGNEVWVLKEELLRTLAREMTVEKKSKK